LDLAERLVQFARRRLANKFAARKAQNLPPQVKNLVGSARLCALVGAVSTADRLPAITSIGASVRPDWVKALRAEAYPKGDCDAKRQSVLSKSSPQFYYTYLPTAY
jgi:hypothetical protein